MTMVRIQFDTMCPHCFLDHRPGSGGTVEVLDINVCNEHRRQGRGKAMVDRLLRTHEGGPEPMHVWALTRAVNEVAVQFWQALRFEPIAIVRRFHSREKGADAVMFGRWINLPKDDNR